jgi:hypothetical protein
MPTKNIKAVDFNDMTAEQKFALLVAWSRTAADDETRASVSRTTFIDGLVQAGFTSKNILPKKKLPAGFNGDWMRPQLLLVGAATIKIKGKRLSDADLVRYADDAVSNKVLLSGTPKGTMRDENGKTIVTWAGQADSWLGKVAVSLAEREAAKVQMPGTPKMTKAKKDVFMDYVQKAYNLTFKEDAPTKDAVAAQKLCRDLAKTVGGTLSTPTKK